MYKCVVTKIIIICQMISPTSCKCMLWLLCVHIDHQPWFRNNSLDAKRGFYSLLYVFEKNPEEWRVYMIMKLRKPYNVVWSHMYFLLFIRTSVNCCVICSFSQPSCWHFGIGKFSLKNIMKYFFTTNLYKC